MMMILLFRRKLVIGIKQRITRRSLVATAMLGTAIPFTLYAADGLNVFTPGAQILSMAVNENFSNLDKRIGVYEAAIPVNQATGNVGIGTSTPAESLHIRGTERTYAKMENQYGSLAIGLGGASAHLDWTGAIEGSEWIFSVNNAPKMTLTPSGNLGIGTTAPEYQLHIKGPESVVAIDRDGTAGNATHLRMQRGGTGVADFITIDTGTLAIDFPFIGPVMALNAGGNVGIGTTTPDYTLDVEGLVRAQNITVASDARLKTDIHPLQKASEGVACLQGVTYRLRDVDASQDVQIGLIAQEVEACFPEVVSTDEEGFKSVAYARLVVPLIEVAKEQQRLSRAQQRAIFEQKALITAQQTEIAALKNAQKAVDARLAKLEALVVQTVE